MHENDGVVNESTELGYVSYWQPHKTSELGTAIIASPNTITGFEKLVSEQKDKSNVCAHLKVQNGKVVYYAGFGWKESGHFKSKNEWEAYIVLFAKKSNNPVTVALID